MSGFVPPAIAGLIVLVCVAVIRSKLRQEEAGGAIRGCLGCLFIVLVIGSLAGVAVRLWREAAWDDQAGRIVVTAVEGASIYAQGEWWGPGPVEIEFEDAPFDSQASPESIVQALFPRRQFLEIQAEGVSTAQTSRGHWVGTTYSVLLRTPDGKLDPVVLFRRTIAEKPLEPARILILRGALGDDRNVTPGNVGIAFSPTNFFERLLFLDDPPQLSVGVQFQQLPTKYRGSEFWLAPP